MPELDLYTLRARLFPSVLAVAPLLALATMFVATVSFGIPQTLVGIAVAVLLYTCAEVGRRFGKSAEKRLFAEYGGRPVFAALRRQSHVFSGATKERYRNFLAAKIGQQVPSSKAERDDPRSVDGFYRDCAAWLREHTRDTEKFKVLFNENIGYGFWRNLRGMKALALVCNVITLVASAVMLWEQGLFPGEPERGLLVVVLVIALIHALFFFVAVTDKAVMEASDNYERQLALATETFLDGEALDT